MRSCCWILISALAWAGAAAAAPPARVELAYEIARNGYTIAEVSYLLEHDGRSYRISETAKGRGILALRGTTRRTSRGLISAQGLRPVEFTDERTGRRTARASFDWARQTVTQQYRGEPRTEPLAPQAHDRLAFIFHFAFAPDKKGDAVFDLYNGRGRSRHLYRPAGGERIKTPVGEFEALKLVREKEGERTELWLATELSYLPLRILVVEDDGTRYEQLPTRISPQ